MIDNAFDALLSFLAIVLLSLRIAVLLLAYSAPCVLPFVIAYLIATGS